MSGRRAEGLGRAGGLDGRFLRGAGRGLDGGFLPEGPPGPDGPGGPARFGRGGGFPGRFRFALGLAIFFDLGLDGRAVFGGGTPLPDEPEPASGDDRAGAWPRFGRALGDGSAPRLLRPCAFMRTLPRRRLRAAPDGPPYPLSAAAAAAAA